MKLGIKFCGNCNPVIDSKKILRIIEEKIINKLGNQVEVVFFDFENVDMLLVISGCPVDCASRPNGSYGELVWAGEKIYKVEVDKENLKIRDIIYKAWQEYFGKENNHLC